MTNYDKMTVEYDKMTVEYDNLFFCHNKFIITIWIILNKFNTKKPVINNWFFLY